MELRKVYILNIFKNGYEKIVFRDYFYFISD